MKSLYNEVCQECSEHITKRYSTSFSLGIRMFDREFRTPIYAIYGFVRFADEIVDTFFNLDQKALLDEFRVDTLKAIHNKFSLNPVLHSFQAVVNEYEIDHSTISAFLDSMEMDLHMYKHNLDTYKKYIYGSAEVVGLMCLSVFLGNDKTSYNKLKPYACALGSAFQKVNFLRDIKSDYIDRGRMYFPNIDFNFFNEDDKKEIEDDIEKEFEYAYVGIRQLPQGVRSGVNTSYTYYLKLFQKIKNSPKEVILTQRVRIPNNRKIYLLAKSIVLNNLGFST